MNSNVPMQREAHKAEFSRRLAKDKYIRACHQAKREGDVGPHFIQPNLPRYWCGKSMTCDLRATMKTVKDTHAFAILAMVVLPEHLHAIWRLPPGDADYPLRWPLIAGARYLR